MEKMFESLGIVEFSDWLYVRDIYRPNREKDVSEVEACLREHLKHGLDQIAFSVGRSTVEYHSNNPIISRHGDMADENYVRECDLVLLKEMEKECFLRKAVDFCRDNKMTIYAHLCMNRHYGKHLYGGALTSSLAMREEMQELNRDGTKDPSRLCFAIEDYRQERMAVIKEVVDIGVDGVCLDFVRQPPMLKYHPSLTGPYKKETGSDPLAISVEREPEEFMKWCKYRAGVLTSFMRDVKRQLKTMELQKERNIPLISRITDDGFTANMIAGIDIKTWCEEKIVDVVVTHPLQWIHGIWTHDVNPYVDLGRITGVKILGGANTYPVHKGFRFNPVCIAERIMQQYEAGVAGISLYETNDTVLHEDLFPILKSIHSLYSMKALLSDHKWREKWPIDGLNANCGMDNHSGSPREVIYEL